MLLAEEDSLTENMHRCKPNESRFEHNVLSINFRFALMHRTFFLTPFILLCTALAADTRESGVLVESVVPDEIDEGYLFWHQADELRNDVENVTLLMDSGGQLVHQWETDLTGGGHTSYLLADGGLLRMGIRDASYVKGQPVAAVDTLQITDKAGRAIWELNAKHLRLGEHNDHKITFHHDAIRLPNGNILALIYEEVGGAEAAALGWRAGKGSTVWSDGLVELKPNLDDGSHALVWVWRWLDHMVQDVDPNAPTFGVVKDNPHKIDAHFPKSYQPLNLVRQHLNSIDYHPALNQILVSAFIYNEIWIIDRSTSTAEAAGSTGGRWGRGGDVLFRYGNPETYGHGERSKRLFDKQHDANWVKPGLRGAGNILVFNNNTRLTAPLTRPGMNRAQTGARMQETLTGISQVIEIQATTAEDGSYVEGFGATEVWRWQHDAFFAPFQGGARRLPNGNTLISDTVGRRVWELNPAGDVVVRYTGSAPVFKAFKYSAEDARALLGG